MRNFCDGHTDVNSNDDDDAVFRCDDVDGKVLDGIEHEEENLYAKPRGKNYRQFSLRSARTSDQNQPNKLDSTQSLQDDIPHGRQIRQ